MNEDNARKNLCGDHISVRKKPPQFNVVKGVRINKYMRAAFD